MKLIIHANNTNSNLLLADKFNIIFHRWRYDDCTQFVCACPLIQFAALVWP